MVRVVRTICHRRPAHRALHPGHRPVSVRAAVPARVPAADG